MILKNEEDRIKLKYGIDMDKLEMDHNRALVTELEEVLDERKGVYKELKTDIKKLEKKRETLTLTLK